MCACHPAIALCSLVPEPRAARIDAGLLRALSFALQVVHAPRARAQALDEFGDIDLPDTSPTAEDAQRLQNVGALYLAHELEAAGLLNTAELIAGLFASGAIMQPLGPTGQLINDFWRTRRERMSAEERAQVFEQVFHAHGFYPLMQAVCDALAGQLDEPGDLRARIALQQTAEALGGWLAQRGGGIVAYAAQDIVQALSQATHFLRDRLLQAAFGAPDLWALVGVVNQAQGSDAAGVRRRVALGREGATVLGWLAGAVPLHAAFDADSPDGQRVMAAAEAWRSEWARGAPTGAVAARGGPIYGVTPSAPVPPNGTGWL